MPTNLEARRRAVVEALRAIALEDRVQDLSAQVHQVLVRLESVETTLLASETSDVQAEPAAGDEEDEERVSVPALPLGEGRMSTAASQALFGH